MAARKKTLERQLEEEEPWANLSYFPAESEESLQMHDRLFTKATSPLPIEIDDATYLDLLSPPPFLPPQ